MCVISFILQDAADALRLLGGKMPLFQPKTPLKNTWLFGRNFAPDHRTTTFKYSTERSFKFKPVLFYDLLVYLASKGRKSRSKVVAIWSVQMMSN